MIYSSLQRSVSVGRAEIIIMHTPSMSDACERHAQSVEKFIASLAPSALLTEIHISFRDKLSARSSRVKLIPT